MFEVESERFRLAGLNQLKNALWRRSCSGSCALPEASENDQCGGEYTSGGQDKHNDPFAVGRLRGRRRLPHRLRALAAPLRVQNVRRKRQAGSQNQGVDEHWRHAPQRGKPAAAIGGDHVRAAALIGRRRASQKGSSRAGPWSANTMLKDRPESGDFPSGGREVAPAMPFLTPQRPPADARRERP